MSELKTLFIDISGSVGGFSDYWHQVETYYKTNESSIGSIYLWDNSIRLTNKTELLEFINKKIGRGGTNPEQIAQTIVQNKIYYNIVIFTDGEVSDFSVANTDNILNKTSIDKVECYIISMSYPNLSVSCPFTRNNESITYYKNGRELEFRIQKNSSQDLALIKNLDSINLDTFNEKYSTIESLLIARNMGKTGDPTTKELLLKLKKNLVKELSSQSKFNYGLDIRECLKSNDFDQALQIARTMTTRYFSSDIGMDIEKKIGYLVSLCGDLRGQYSIDSIRSNRMMRADTVQIETVSTVDIDINDLITKPIECPIIMDLDVPQIMILDLDEPVLANFDKHIVDDIANCPLRILNYPEVVSKLARSISQWTGTKINQYLEFNPFTKQQLIGTIPLGNCSQHVKCGNYTISRLFSSGKLLGNINLYYAVIWYLIKSGKFEYLNDIKEQVTEHLTYRLINSNTNASLCGLPQFVLTKVPTDVAIWYCINSCLLNQPTDRDTVRFHLFNLDPMLDIMSVFGYPIDEKSIKQINRVKVLISMLSIVKKNELDFRNRIFCLNQNAIQIDSNKLSEKVIHREKVVQWIPIDGPASDQQVEQILDSFPKYYRNLTVDELVGLASFVNPSKSASNINLETSWVPTKSQHIFNWIYRDRKPEQLTISICPSTFRPYYMVRDGNQIVKWTELAEKLNGPIHKQISCCGKFIDYFIKYGEFPNFESFLTFCLNRYSNNLGSSATLPYQIKQFYENVLNSYRPIFQLIKEKSMTLDQVYKILNDSCSIVNRLKMESITNSNSLS
jgi:hypothetical protein